MQIAQCIFLAFLLNLITVHKIKTESDVSTDVTDYITTNASDTTIFTWNNITTTDTIDEDKNSTESETKFFRLSLQVVVSPNNLRVRLGETYEVICNVYGADTSIHVYWIQEKPERRYIFTNTNDTYVSESRVTLRILVTLIHRGNIGEYTCVAEDPQRNINTATITMQEIPGYQQPITWCGNGFKILQIIAPDIFDGDDVVMQCVGAKMSDSKHIKWYFNSQVITDEEPFHPYGKMLRIHPVSRLYSGEYRCSILDPMYREAHRTLTFIKQPSENVPPVFNPLSPLFISEGVRQLIQSPPGYNFTYWKYDNVDRLPRGVYQIANNLLITHAHFNHSGTYNCKLYKKNGTHIDISYEIRVQPSQTYGPLKISIHPQTIDLKEGENKTIQYTIASSEPVEILWNKYTDQGYEPMSSAFTIESNRLTLHHATPDIAGIYHLIVCNSHDEAHQTLRINVQSRWQKQQHESVEILVQPKKVIIGPGEKVTVRCRVKGVQQYQVIWSLYSHHNIFPHFITQRGNDVIVAPTATTPDETIYLQCQVDAPDQFRLCHAYVPVYIHDGERKKRDITLLKRQSNPYIHLYPKN
ncbi:hypothetical protein I4U23_004855 [Adineta vaga]|nr:hypothetical protein I4U23_004855 [Adineta vaga]